MHSIGVHIMSISIRQLFFSAILVASLACSLGANAQDRKNEETAEEDQAKGENTAEEQAIVLKQNECNIILKNAASLAENQKVKLSKSETLTGTAVVRKINANGTAQATLSKKVCAKDFVGATVEPIQSNSTQETTRADSSNSEKLPPGVGRDSSAHERIRNKVVLRAGGGLMFAPGITLAAGYNLSHKFNIEGSYDSAGLNFLELYKYSRMRIGGLANYFLGDSFHAAGGMIFEKFTSGTLGGKADENGLTTIENAFTADINQLQLQIGIGNRWNNGKLVFGSEWVGLSIPITNLSENYKRDSSVTDATFESNKDSNKKFASGNSFRLLNCYLGVSF
jgi:hypothetical protein